MSQRFEDLTAPELEALARERTVFLFAVGPLEDHGPHLPMGLDLDEAEHLCAAAGERIERENPGWKSVIMPRAPLGIDSETTRTAITVRAHVLRDWLVDASCALARMGFLHFICFTGQLGPRQLTAIEEAGRILRKRNGGGWLRSRLSRRRIPALCSASSALVSMQEALSSPLWPDPAEHAGKRDTSVALAITPARVEEIYPHLPESRRPDSIWSRLGRRITRKSSGYWGRPGDANAQTGTQALSSALDEVYPKLRMVLEGSKPEAVFRSWYSAFPPNRSFFKAWCLVVVLMFLIGAWVYISFRAMISG